jgi:hypothetical protein
VTDTSEGDVEKDVVIAQLSSFEVKACEWCTFTLRCKTAYLCHDYSLFLLRFLEFVKWQWIARNMTGSRVSCSNSTHVVSAAEHFIGYFLAGTNVAHNYLLTLRHHFPSDGARIMCSPRATPTERLNLQGIDSVGELYQTTRTRKKLGSKVSENSKGVYIDSESIHNAR